MISSKFKWILGLSLVFVLIVTTNLIDRNNFKRIRESIVTIYEDRLIAKNYIFELSLLLEEKTIELAASKDSTFFGSKSNVVNDQVESFIRKFHQTRLTTQEEATLKNFENDFKALVLLEKSGDRIRVLNQIKRLKKDLYTLSEIQLKEGKKQLIIGSKAVNSVELLTRLEIIMLVIIAVIVLFLLIYNPKNK
ncbi:MAG: chemotaxis protein [Marinoscillum sp.]